MATVKVQMLNGLHVTDLKYSLDGMSLSQAAEKLLEVKAEKEKEGWGNLRLEIEAEDDGYDGDYAKVRVLGDRWETQEEAVLREGTARQRAKFVEDQQRRQYEELKKKFAS